jgi:hypothetical protein
MAVSPYDLEQKFEHELDVLEGEIDEVLNKFSVMKGGVIRIPPPKQFKLQHQQELFTRYLSVGWSSVKFISDMKEGSHIEFKY